MSNNYYLTSHLLMFCSGIFAVSLLLSILSYFGAVPTFDMVTILVSAISFVTFFWAFLSIRNKEHQQEGIE